MHDHFHSVHPGPASPSGQTGLPHWEVKKIETTKACLFKGVVRLIAPSVLIRGLLCDDEAWLFPAYTMAGPASKNAQDVPAPDSYLCLPAPSLAGIQGLQISRNEEKLPIPCHLQPCQDEVIAHGCSFLHESQSVPFLQIGWFKKPLHLESGYLTWRMDLRPSSILLSIREQLVREKEKAELLARIMSHPARGQEKRL